MYLVQYGHAMGTHDENPKAHNHGILIHVVCRDKSGTSRRNMDSCTPRYVLPFTILTSFFSIQHFHLTLLALKVKVLYLVRKIRVLIGC